MPDLVCHHCMDINLCLLATTELHCLVFNQYNYTCSGNYSQVGTKTDVILYVGVQFILLRGEPRLQTLF